MNSEGIDVAARLGALGLDPLRFLYTNDPFERNMILVLGTKIQKYRNELDRNLAVQIANAVGQLFK